MNGHTPGPWQAMNSADTAIALSHIKSQPSPVMRGFTQDICVVKGHAKDRELIEANARLIAAAPDLLEALKKMVDVYNRDHFMQTADCHPTDCDCGRCDRDRAVAAIAKATGGSNV